MTGNEVLAKIGIKDSTFDFLTVAQLVKRGIIEKPLDGNHGEIHPKGEDFVASGIPFIMASDISNGVVDYLGCKFITRKQADSLRKGFAKNGDVLLTHKATIGRTAIVKYDGQPYVMLTPQVTYYRVRDHQKLDHRYLRYYFESAFFQDILSLWAGAGSTRAYLGITEQGKLPFVLPPISKQKKIAAILSAYDDLIENNRRRIALLEKMAEEIYREWFVRLRFPGHEQAKFVKGVPCNWRQMNLGELLELCYGKALKDENRVPGKYPVYGSGGVVGVHEKGMAEGPGIIVGRKGNVGSVYWSDGAFFPIDTVYYVKSDVSMYFLFFLLRSMNFINNDAAVPGLNRSQAYSNKLLMPPPELVKAFGEQAKPLFDLKRNCAEQVAALAMTRDALLPRLISGKLPVEALDIRFPPSMEEPAHEV